MTDEASRQATALVNSTILDCLLQCLMNKGMLLPSEVNDIFEAAGLLISQKYEGSADMAQVLEFAKADIEDRLGREP